MLDKKVFYRKTVVAVGYMRCLEKLATGKERDVQTTVRKRRGPSSSPSVGTNHSPIEAERLRKTKSGADKAVAKTIR